MELQIEAALLKPDEKATLIFNNTCFFDHNIVVNFFHPGIANRPLLFIAEWTKMLKEK